MSVVRLVALVSFLVAADASLAVEPSDIIGEYVRGRAYERFGVRLVLWTEQRWTTVKTSGEPDVFEGTWRIDGEKVLLLKKGSADWESAGRLSVVPLDSSFVLVQDYDAGKPLEEQHYFERSSKQ